MKRLHAILLLACISLIPPVAAIPGNSAFDRAREAWDNGDFIRALEGFAGILGGPEAARFLDPIALLTGELHPVQELAPDGRSVRFSSTGRYAVYETGGRSDRVTRILDTATGNVAAELRGTGAVFSPDDGFVAYLQAVETEELRTLRGELEQLQARPQPDRQAIAERQRRIAAAEAAAAAITLRHLATGHEQRLADGGLLKFSLAYSADGGEVYFSGMEGAGAAAGEIYAVSPTLDEPRPLTSGKGFKVDPIAVPGGHFLVCTVTSASPLAQGPGAMTGARAPGGGPQAPTREVAITSLADGRMRSFAGASPTLSADGSTLAFLAQSGQESQLQVVKLAGDLEPKVVRKSPERINSAALSPDGALVAFETTIHLNAEIFVIDADGRAERRVTREIQHDRSPRFLDSGTLLAIKGERRHSRSYAYDLRTMAGTRLFHNNTVRTIAPEYEWAPSPDGSRLLIVSERDGDTISLERGVYLLDRSRRISLGELQARIQANLAAERDLRARGESLFRPIAGRVREIAAGVSIHRLYEYQEALFQFDSKHISQPGNKLAGEYLHAAFQSFGYEPEFQWFNVGNIRTASVLAELRGTENPELVYVLCSHYDSNQRGPGADDNTSAIAVMLETARLLAGKPMPATILFAALTGEESGLLGSREFVRQAKEKGMRIAGVVNNDTIGWSNDQRLDNLIRYSSQGIRDVQHAAAMLFSKMITYDSRYVKSTDAVPFYEAYGDIVGGLGSYPLLGTPYYHQPTDLLETVNQELLVEATKANIAWAMRLAYGPSRLTEMRVTASSGGRIEATWTAGPEKGITGYEVRYGPGGDPGRKAVTVKEPRAVIADMPLAGGETVHIAVRSIGAAGNHGWDWITATATLAK